jgi:glycosyltransferase involved in cell wall biosynthesis
MNSNLTVSVVIPAYNADKYIEESINSVITQTYPIMEIIIVNDGSTDNTKSILNKYEFLYENVTCIHQDNMGLSNARNSGIKKSAGDFIAFLDSDDLWEDNKIELQVELFLSHPELGLVYSGYKLCDENSNTYEGHITNPKVSGDVLNALLSEGNLISGSGSSVLIRQEVFDDVGMFDSNLAFAEDLDMWIRISEKYKVDFVPEKLVIIRTHLASMQSKYSSYYALFMANLPLYYKHSKYFIDNDTLMSKLKNDCIYYIVSDFFSGYKKFNNKNIIIHAMKLKFLDRYLFNDKKEFLFLLCSRFYTDFNIMRKMSLLKRWLFSLFKLS